MQLNVICNYKIFRGSYFYWGVGGALYPLDCSLIINFFRVTLAKRQRRDKWVLVVLPLDLRSSAQTSDHAFKVWAEMEVVQRWRTREAQMRGTNGSVFESNSLFLPIFLVIFFSTKRPTTLLFESLRSSFASPFLGRGRVEPPSTIALMSEKHSKTLHSSKMKHLA